MVVVPGVPSPDVRIAGLEPARSYEHQILSLRRLPFRHIRIKKQNGTSIIGPNIKTLPIPCGHHFVFNAFKGCNYTLHPCQPHGSLRR